jgi:hypothetical protein
MPPRCLGLSLIFILSLFLTIHSARSEPSNLGQHWARVAPSREGYHFSSLRAKGDGFIATRWGQDWTDSILSISSDGIHWKTVYQPSQRVHLNDAVWGNGIHVAVGENGHIVRSTHGYAWNPVVSGVTEPLAAVVWSGSAFVAVGYEGSILRSTEGLNWQVSKPAGNIRLNTIFRTDQELAAVGANGTLLISTDHGSNWQPISTSPDYDFRGGTRIAGGLLLYSKSGSYTKFVLRDDTGLITEMANPIQGSPVSISKHAGGYLLTTDGGRVCTSIDGTSWLELEEKILEGSATICPTEDGWLLGGARGETIRFSPGISWNKPAESNYSLLTAIGNSGKYYALGDWGHIHKSNDGVNWTAGNHLDSSYVWRGCVTWQEGVLVVGGKGKVTWFKEGSTTKYRVMSAAATDTHGVAASSTRLVAVGKKGQIYRSDNGDTWVASTSGTQADLFSVEYAFNKFHAVGAGGIILTSSDGVTWTSGSSPTTADLKRVKKTSRGLVAVGNGGVILENMNGSAWVSRSSGVERNLSAVIESPNEVFVLGERGTVLKSVNGEDWFDETPSYGEFVGDFTDGLFINGRLIALSEDRKKYSVTGSVRSSYFSLGCIRQSSPGSAMNGVGYSNGLFIRVGNGGLIQTSTDGKVWEPRKSPVNFDLWDVTTSPDLMVAVGNGGILTSADGILWNLTSSSGLRFRRVHYGGGVWVACGYSGALMVSNDGYNWRHPQDPNNAVGTTNFRGVSWSDGRFVVCGDGGTILVSSDAETWTKTPSPTSSHLYGVARLSNGFMAGVSGEHSQILLSQDGLSWTLTSGSPIPWGTVVETIGERCYIADKHEALYSTTDGLSWRCHRNGYWNPSFSLSLYEAAVGDIAGTESNLVTTAAGGVCSHSNDSDQWIYTEGIVQQSFTNLFRAHDRFIALAANSVILTTLDGRRWTRHRTNLSYGKKLVGFASNGNRSIVVGDSVLYSDDLWEWTTIANPPDTSLTAAIWTGTTFLAAGIDNALYASPNGLDWAKVAQFSRPIQGITAHAGTQLAWVQHQLFASSDGLDWAEIHPALETTRYSYFHQDQSGIIASGGGASAAISTDSNDWTEHFNSGKGVGRIARGASGHYVCLSEPPNTVGFSTILSSEDGTTWNDTGLIHPANPRGIASSGDLLIAVYENGAILISADVPSIAFQNDLMAEGYPLTQDLAPESDPDGDQIPNMIARYFGIQLGTPATQQERSRLPQLSLAPGDENGIQFSIPDNPPPYMGLVFEESSDLIDWTPIAVRHPVDGWTSEREIRSQSTGDGYSAVEIGLDSIPSEVTNRFWRVRVIDLP